ncbi:MAG: hypothetical protein IJ195_11110 [Lachnospiraceae bacterium]|nr:hypothetical protein [Lachnospiraceae bacterium]
MKKKILAIMFALTMCTSLSACGSVSDGNSSDDREETVTVGSESTSEESEAQENFAAEEERLAEEENTYVGHMNDEGYYVFGLYEQDGDESNGPEPIEWAILDENKNGTLLISRYVLDCVQFNTTKTEVSWETCSLRSWMNDVFYNAAFNDAEKASINTEERTNDKIFALNVGEERRYYGNFDPWYSQCSFRGGQSPIAQPTKYAESRGVYSNIVKNDDYWMSGEKYSANWWLRSLRGPTDKTDDEACVFDSDVNCFRAVDRDDIGVRPALYISDKLPWEPETQTENAVSQKPAVVEESEVEGPAIEEPAIEEPEVEGPAIEGPAIEGPAIVEGPATEEGVAEEKKRADGFINDEGYYVFGLYEQDGDVSNGPEPIEWETLDENENGTLLVSRYVLDNVKYNDNKEKVTWETCSLRSWMNDDFYNAAFDDEMKARINTVTIVNEDNPRYGTPGGNDTSDKVFCLSLSEILKYYSFNEWNSDGWWGYSQALIIPPTKYATDNGVFTYTISDNYYQLFLAPVDFSDDCIGKECAFWWLRSPGNSSKRACLVEAYGRADSNCSTWVGSNLVVYSWSDEIGVRPALYINK